MALKSAGAQAKSEKSRGEGQVNELLLIVTIAGQRVALPAARSNPSSSSTRLIPVPRAAPHVAGLSALRSRVLTVIDCMRSLELGTSDRSDGIREAAVVELDGHHYALIVDVVEDVVEAASDPSPVRAAMGAGWERVSKGMVETEAGPLLLVDVAALIAGAEARAA
jgi:purine-binding chemotaxis protein CheW